MRARRQDPTELRENRAGRTGIEVLHHAQVPDARDRTVAEGEAEDVSLQETTENRHRPGLKKRGRGEVERHEGPLPPRDAAGGLRRAATALDEDPARREVGLRIVADCAADDLRPDERGDAPEDGALAARRVPVLFPRLVVC